MRIWTWAANELGCSLVSHLIILQKYRCLCKIALSSSLTSWSSKSLSLMSIGRLFAGYSNLRELFCQSLSCLDVYRMRLHYSMVKTSGCLPRDFAVFQYCAKSADHFVASLSLKQKYFSREAWHDNVRAFNWENYKRGTFCPMWWSIPCWLLAWTWCLTATLTFILQLSILKLLPNKICSRSIKPQ